MYTRWGFYLRNSVLNLKNSILLILGIGLAVSMISGMSYYYDSFENEIFTIEFPHIDDIAFQFNPENEHSGINFSNNFDQKYQSTANSIQTSDLQIESTHKYAYLSSNYGNTFSLFSSVCTLCIFNTDVFTSPRFQDYIELVEGTYPINENEIVMDYATTKIMNYSIGSPVNLPLLLDLDGPPLIYNITNLILSGTYTSAKINDRNFSFDEFHHQIGYSIEELPYINLDTYMGVGLVFSYSNFSIDSHPFQLIYQKIYDDLVSSYQYFPITVQSGVAIFSDRLNLHLNRIISTAKNVEEECLKIQIQSGVDIEYNNYFSEKLLSGIEYYNSLRYTLLLLNIPIFTAAIILATYGLNLSIQQREEQILLMKSRGMPRSMIKNAFLVEMTMMSCFIFVLGFLGGIGSFYGFNSWFKNLHVFGIEVFGNQDLSFVMTFKSIGISFGAVLLLMAFSSLSSLKKIGKIATNSNVLSSISRQQDKNSLNEEQIFGLMGFTTNLTRRQGKKQKKKRNPEPKAKKWSIVLILVGGIPILFYLVVLLSNMFDTFYFLSGIVSNSIDVFIPLVFPLCGLSLCIGVIRLLTTERKKWFARIVSKISSIFLKKQGYLVGVNLTQKKGIFLLMFILCGFSGILIQNNIYINSNYQYHEIEQNLHIGTDFNGLFQTGGFIENNSMLEELKTNFLSLNKSGDSIVDDMQFVLKDSLSPLEAVIHYVNFSQYRDMIFQEGKTIPVSGLETNIEILLQNKNVSVYAVGVANGKFLSYHDLKVGDFYTFTHEYNNFSMSIDDEFTTQITCKIMAQIDILPGINPGVLELNNSESPNGGYLTLDISCLDMHPSLRHSSEIIQLVNLNKTLQVSAQDVELSFKTLLSNFTSYEAYSFYQDFSGVSYSAFDQGSGYYGIIYVGLLIIGIFLSIGIAIFLNSIIHQDTYTIGILLSRGFGRRNISKYVLCQWLIIILFPVLISIFIGGLSAIIFAKLQQFIILRSISLFSVPIYLNIRELGLVFSSVIIFTLLISVLPFIFGFKKEISNYLHKF